MTGLLAALVVVVGGIAALLAGSGKLALPGQAR